MISRIPDSKEYRRRLRKALQNKPLGATLENLAAARQSARERAFDGIDLDAATAELVQGIDAALPRLELLFEAFQANAEAAGATVHLALTPKEANEIIVSIAGSNRVESIVKSRSITTREIFLNSYLEADGLQVTETELGDWLLQRRGGEPSHMVMPAMHVSRDEVAEFLTQITGEAHHPDDADVLVEVARKELRGALLEADMGITGANFAIASTGTIGIVSNDGNARLVATLPRVHVAVVGLDKLVPDLRSALRILKMLPRSATGQAITSYVSWITGATECRSAPKGRKAMHIVFLDNGRLSMAKDPVFSSALRCIRCGACADVCPIYRLVGGQNYGHVYVGPIGLILTYFFHGRDNARIIVQNCLNCQACRTVCPSGIDLPHLIQEVHNAILKEDGQKPLKNILLARILKDRRLFHFFLRRAYLAQKPLAWKQSFIRHLPLFFGKEHGYRSLPAIARKPLRDSWAGIRRGVKDPLHRVALFGGCLVDFVYPEEARALVQVLRREQVQVEFPEDQTCCGLPAQMMGEKEIAREVALHNLMAVDPSGFDYIVTLCASCGSHLKRSYGELLSGRPDLQARLELFTYKVIDVSSFMVDVLGIRSEAFNGKNQKAAYHAPCHLCRGLGSTKASRALLQRAGLEYMPSREEEVCCGFGGSYSLLFPEIAGELMRRKLESIEATGAELLVTECPGCILQLRGGVDMRKSRLQVKHMTEVLAERLQPEKDNP